MDGVKAHQGCEQPPTGLGGPFIEQDWIAGKTGLGPEGASKRREAQSKPRRPREKNLDITAITVR